MTTETQHPEGDYAIVEILGHQTFVGRVSEVEKFGSSMLQIEPIYRDTLLSPILQGGASIYRYTPCSAETAFARAPTSSWSLPAAIKAVLPEGLKDKPAALPAPEANDAELVEVDDLDGEMPF
ncbi:MAG: hypothetical protein AAF225_10290 [Pseudomonadota bacterium]